MRLEDLREGMQVRVARLKFVFPSSGERYTKLIGQVVTISDVRATNYPFPVLISHRGEAFALQLIEIEPIESTLPDVAQLEEI